MVVVVRVGVRVTFNSLFQIDKCIYVTVGVNHNNVGVIRFTLQIIYMLAQATCKCGNDFQGA